MYNRDASLAASRAEIAQLAQQSFSEVTPSRRDFAMYVATQRQDLALIARLGPGTNRTRLVEQARACDDAEIAALAVSTGPDTWSGDDLRAVSDAVTAPILRENLVVHPHQLLHGRLHGADAALLAAGAVDDRTLQELVAMARSLHMASVIEVANASELTVAQGLPHVIVGLRCLATDGRLDIAATQQLAQRASSQCPLIVLPDVTATAQCEALRGVVDAVCVVASVTGPALDQ